MFYAQFVLSKKGPLAKIWLAAHWEKKLTKAHVFETNIDKAVESILEPKVKMALRTTGHLLLGLVRIYSRKAKYLLADCNEAFLKIKMAFRPGTVDLPEEGREASLNAITLPEVFHDFDSALPDFGDIDYQQQLTLNQSRIEDITLKEDFPRSTILDQEDDEFGDGGMAFDSIEHLRDADFSHRSVDLGLTLRPEESKRSMDLDIDAPIMDNDFGGELDANLLDGDLNLFGDDVQPAEDMEFGGAVEDSDSDQGTTPQQKKQVAAANSIVTNTTEQTTLITNEEEAFALEPADKTGVEKGVRGKRRRKLIVDEMKSISGEEMKQQLSDPSDTLIQLDLAPPTKKLMHWKETGGVDKLLVLPGLELASKQLQKLFTRNCTSRHQPQQAQDECLIDVDDPEQLRLASPSNIPTSPSAIGRGEVTLPTIVEEERQPPSVHSEEPFSPWVAPETPYANHADAMDDNIKSPGPSRSPRKTTESSKSPQKSVAQEEDEQIIEDEEEEEEAVGEPRWTKRTQAFLNTVSRHLRHQERVSFKEITRGKGQKQAAQCFYNVLVLRKWEHIEVEQQDAFGDILLSHGSQFEVRA